mgnify:CR=1 FL=1
MAFIGLIPILAYVLKIDILATIAKIAEFSTTMVIVTTVIITILIVIIIFRL